MKNTLQKNIIKNRVSAVKVLLKDEVDIFRLEREVAFLMLDVLAAIETKTLSLKQSDKIFTDIAYGIGEKMEQKTSEDFSMLLAEAVLLDEVNTKYGPNLAELRELAVRILTHDKKLVQFSMPARVLA